MGWNRVTNALIKPEHIGSASKGISRKNNPEYHENSLFKMNSNSLRLISFCSASSNLFIYFVSIRNPILTFSSSGSSSYYEPVWEALTIYF